MLIHTSKLIKKRAAKPVSRGKQTIHAIPKDSVYETLKANPTASICIIRALGGIGDVLMCTPALRQLRKTFPLAYITFAIDRHSTETDIYYELLKHCPFINKIIDARYVNRSIYNAICDITSVCIRYEQHNFLPMNRIDIFARAIGIPYLEDPCSWYETSLEEDLWAQKQTISARPKVFLHTASMDPKRCWPPEKYIDLIHLLKDKVSIYVMDFNHVVNIPDCIHDVSSTNVRQMAALIKQMDLFIGPDSGPMHIAGALHKPSIVLFGSIPPEVRINHYPSHEAIKLNLSCSPCWYKSCPYNNKCMRDLDVSLVYKRIKEKLHV